MSQEYVCAACGATTARGYTVPMLVRTCEQCEEWGQFIRAGLLELADRVPDGDRPDDWGSLSGEERMQVAIEQGYVSISDLRA